MIYRRLLAFFLSFALIFSSTSALAASPAGWAIQSVTMQGASAVIKAAKQGFTSTASYAPAVGKIAVEIGKGAGVVAVAYALSKILDAGVDYVLDPANNRVQYKKVVPLADSCTTTNSLGASIVVTDMAAYGNTACSQAGDKFSHIESFDGGLNRLQCEYRANIADVWCTSGGTELQDAYVPFNQIASQIVSDASAGNVASQDFLKIQAVAAAQSGEVDGQLSANAVPSDLPFNPDDDVSVPFDSSSIIAAIESIKSIIDNAFSSLSAKINSLAVSIGVIDGKVDDIAAEQQRTMQVINDGMADVVAANNATGARVGDVVAAIEALEGNMLTGEVINAAIDRAIAAGHTDTASIVAAIEAIEGNTLDGQVINDAIDRVIANDNANAQSAADAATAAADAAKAADAANTAAVTDAIGAQTDAITDTDPVTGDKSLKLPSYCSWAAPVCSAIEWVKTSYNSMSEWLKSDPDGDNDVVIPDVPLPEPDTDISFGGSCPADLGADFNLYGTNFNFVLMPFSKMCPLLNTFIKPTLILLGSFMAVTIVGGRKET